MPPIKQWKIKVERAHGFLTKIVHKIALVGMFYKRMIDKKVEIMKLKNTLKDVERIQNKFSGEEQKECCSSEATSSSGHVPREKEEQIRQKAYELYEKKGCQSGHDQEDWFEAEKEICE